jgi:hypothetical protein
MAAINAEGVYRTGKTGAGALVILPAAGPAGGLRMTLATYAGEPLPGEIHDPRLERLGAPGRWRLICREGSYEFTTDGVEIHRAMPGLFDDLLARHGLRARDRTMVRCLLRLLGLPGGARLLRAWHARRGR